MTASRNPMSSSESRKIRIVAGSRESICSTIEDIAYLLECTAIQIVSGSISATDSLHQNCEATLLRPFVCRVWRRVKHSANLLRHTLGIGRLLQRFRALVHSDSE